LGDSGQDVTQPEQILATLAPDAGSYKYRMKGLGQQMREVLKENVRKGRTNYAFEWGYCRVHGRKHWEFYAVGDKPTCELV